MEHFTVGILLLAVSTVSSFVPCTINTSTAKSTGNYIKDCAIGCDVSDNAHDFPNPFAWFTNPNYPGVTLPANRHCEDHESDFKWTPLENTCLFDGGGYPFPYSYDGTLTKPECAMDLYSGGISQFKDNFNKWQQLAVKAPKEPVSGARLVSVTSPSTNKDVQAAISIGHGMLNGLCGDCFLIEYNGRYMVQLQVDVRAWSLEATTEAATYVNPGDYGGNCRIPNVVQIDCSLPK